MTETASRNGFNIHSRAYYENIFNDLEKVKDSYIVIARYKEQILVVDLFIVYGGVTNYVYGASSNEERTRMPSYAAQWTAIRHAKALGSSAYNFGGIANEASVYKGWDGLTKFKVRFGGYEVLHTDFYDIVVKSLWYNLYNFRKWINKIKK
jgi:lipid II:glycine glycyltransferase (peptidoglycan interpeptide bridge formation enzyme)